MDSGIKKLSIYDLELHQTIQVTSTRGNQTEIMRVPGGWVYTTIAEHTISRMKFNSPLDGFSVSTTFVPYSEEYKDKSMDVLPEEKAEKLEKTLKDRGH